jgi:catechol 2,3-dioxygenase-like lactoylglutathione lyase family enzyme
MLGFHHVKIPVADLSRSRDWYCTVLGLQVALEFVEDGVVRGLALRDAEGRVSLALRHAPERAAAWRGFDPIALAVTRDDVEAWRRRLDELGQPHGGIVRGHEGGAVLVGLRDPDDIEIRLYAD